METKFSIVQFLFTKDWKVLADSLNYPPALPHQQINATPDLLKFCTSEQCCLVIVNVSSKDDLIQLATFAKSAKKTLKGNILKIVAINATQNMQFEKAIGKLGNIEVLDPSLNVKALRFKIDFWARAMKGQARKLASGAFQHKTLEAGATEAQAETKSLVQVPALDCENDIWILSKESDCKKIIGRWIVKLLGPSPYVGSWNEVPNKKNVWTFQIKKNFVENFLSGEGSWLFKGEQKPEFNWQENRWMITGDDFELFFYDGSVHSRLKLSNKVMSLAGNSAFAKTKEPLIIETLDKDFVFKNSGEVIKDPSLEFENEGDLGGHIEGKVKDKEEQKKGNLEGRIKEKAEQKKDQLEGKVKDKEDKKGNLEGQIKDKEENKGNLEGQIKDKEESRKGHLEGKVKEKEEAKKGHLEGQVQDKEESKKGHLEGKVKEEEERKGAVEGKIKEKEEPKKGHLEGKLKEKVVSIHEDLEGIVKELEEGKGPLKGKLGEAAQVLSKENSEEKKHAQNNEKLQSNWQGRHEKSQQAGAKSPEEHKQHNEKLSKRWGGKTNEYSAEAKDKQEEDDVKKPKKDLTDHLDSHWGGKGGSESVSTKGKAGPGVEAHKDGSLLDLKKTDKEHQTHYRNHNEATQYDADGTRKNQYKEGEQGNLGGKTDTEHLASHYGRGQSHESKASESRGPLEGNHETEKLQAHMGRKNIERPESTQEKTDEKRSPLAGKGKTEKLKGHFGRVNRAAGLNRPAPGEGHDFAREDFDDVIGELEGKYSSEIDDLDLGDLVAPTQADVLPFQAKKSDEKELEKLVENAVMTSFIIQGKNKFACKLDDYFENNVILLSSGEGLQNSEPASLDIVMNYRGEKAQINCQGMVMSLDEDGNGGFFISVEILEKDTPMFDEFMNLLKERQESIDSFLKQVKGL
ncbi:MAG: hypothetical protein ACJ76H_17250 [Bacteriovoracaceae bacterium]